VKGRSRAKGRASEKGKKRPDKKSSLVNSERSDIVAEECKFKGFSKREMPSGMKDTKKQQKLQRLGTLEVLTQTGSREGGRKKKVVSNSTQYLTLVKTNRNEI